MVFNYRWVFSKKTLLSFTIVRKLPIVKLSAGMKPFSEALRFIDNANSQINQALLYAPSKAARDLIAVPFALVEFMRDWSIRHPNEASDAIKAVFSGIKNSVSPEYWQSHTPESLGEYSESLSFTIVRKLPIVKL